jgi:hypothetical protein
MGGTLFSKGKKQARSRHDTLLLQLSCYELPPHDSWRNTQQLARIMK